MPDAYTDHLQNDQIRDPQVRAGDRDRDAVADILREQHLAGRLNNEEFEERLETCYAATTYGELDGLIADLPHQHASRRVAPAHAGPRVAAARRWPALALMPLLIAAIALSHGHLLWLVIPLVVFVGRPSLWHRGGRRHWDLGGRRHWHVVGHRYGSVFMGCAGQLVRPGRA